MKVYQGHYKTMNNNEPTIIAIGNFDGVHRGHQALIEKLFLEGQGLKKAILTFKPHTMQLFTKGNFQTIGTSEDKVDLLNNYNLDYTYLVDFDFEFSNLRITEMINFLKQLNVRKVVVGSDFKFGQKGMGRPLDLENDFEVFVVGDIIEGNQRISSTLIKELIINGDLISATNLLNHPYEISAKVVHGNQVGSSILGFPTANLDYNNLILPPNGVYYAQVTHNKEKYFAMANIGYNPTINYSEVKKLEVYILDFNKKIYGDYIKLEFIRWMRSEKKFSSKEELIDQLNKDRENIKKLAKLG